MQKNIYLIFLSFLLFSFSTFAQQSTATATGTVKGVLRDTLHHYVLKSATVSVYKADSTLLSYQLSNNYGEFHFKNLPIGQNLRITVSHIGYQHYHKNFVIPTDTKLTDLKKLIILPSSKALKEVEITIPPITMNGDTLEFNAGAFKLDSNAVVEDLLKKIPNITLWGDGQITVNGREVKSLLVNGKEFFGGDFKIATQNIASNALQKVQVYNTVNEANPLDSNLTVNLKLKKGKDIGHFGKIGVGYGSNRNYETDAGLNIFTPKLQAAVIGAANNINKVANDVNTLMRNSTFKGVGTNVEYQPNFRTTGLNRPIAAGFSFTYNFIEKPTWDKRHSLKSNYFTQNKFLNAQSETNSTTTLSTSDKIYSHSLNTNNNETNNHRFDATYEWANRGQSLTLSPSINFGNSHSESKSLGSTSDAQHNLTSTNNAENTSSYTNKNVAIRANYNKHYNYLRPEDWLRDFRFSYNLNVNKTNNERLNITEFRSLQDATANQDFNRRYHDQGNTLNQNMEVTLGDLKRWVFGEARLWDISFALKNKMDINHKENNTLVEDLNVTNNTYLPNSYLSKNLTTNQIGNVSSLQISKGLSKNLTNRYNKSITFSIEPGYLYIVQKNISDRAFQNINQNHIQFIPDAGISVYNYQYGRYRRNVNLNFTNNVDMPNIQQLAPLVDSTNMYYLQKGNLNLHPAISRDLTLSFSHNDQKGKNTLNYNLSFSGSMIEHQITDSTLIDNLSRRTIYYINAEGARSLNMRGSISKAYKFKTGELQVNLNTSMNISRNPSYINQVFGYANNTNTSTGINLNYTYQQNWAIVIGQQFNTYSAIQKALNSAYKGDNLTTSLSTVYNITKKLTLNSNINFNQSRSSQTANINFTIWNASAVYRFLKGNNAEFKFSALDLLHQNNSVINYGRANSYTLGTQKVLQHYFMTTISYYPRKFGRETAKK